MQTIIKKTIIFTFEEIYEIFLEKKSNKNDFAYKMNYEKDTNTFSIQGTKVVTQEQINAVIKKEIKKAGEKNDFDISVEGAGFVCREKKNSSGANDSIVDTGQNLLQFLKDNFSFPERQGRAVRIHNCLKVYFREGATLLDLLQTSKHDLLKCRNYGLKAHNFLLETLKEIGINTKTYPVAKG